jgi:phage terminase small subunit
MKKPPPKQRKTLNVRQERFADFVASGIPAMRAYGMAGYSDKGRNADANASALMGNHGVKERIAELRAEASKRTEFKKDDLIRDLVAVWKTPVGDIDETSQFAQESVIDQIAGGSHGKLKRGKAASGNEKVEPVTIRRRIKSVDKLACVRLLTELLGWKEPEQLVVDAGPNTLEAVRKRAAEMASAMARTRVEYEGKKAE